MSASWFRFGLWPQSSEEANKVFFDTNTLLYLIDGEDVRSLQAAKLIEQGGSISVQVLNEFVNVARKKLHKNWDEIGEALAGIRKVCEPPLPLTVDSHDAALKIAARYGFAIYDALILASAIEAGCDVLYSEDMQHGQRIDRLVIRNPFRSQ